MSRERHVTLQQVEKLVFQLFLDRSIQVSPIEFGSLAYELWRRTQEALGNEDHFDRLTGMERLWCPTGRAEDQEWFDRHAGLERPRVHSPAQIADLNRRIQQLRQGGSGRGLTSVADAMIDHLRASREVKVLIADDALRFMFLKMLNSPAVEAAVEPLDAVGVPPMPGPDSGGGAPAEARVSDVPPKPRPPEPDLDRRERKDEVSGDPKRKGDA